MAEKYITLKREAWETLCGAVKNLSSVSDAINDSGTLATNQTYSNFKINELLTEIETSISDVSDKVDNLEFIDDTLVSTDKAFSSQKTTSLINNPYEYVIDSSIYGADILQYSLGHYKVGNNSTISEFTNLPVNIAGMLDVMCPASGGNQSPWESQYGYRYYRYTTYKGGTYERTLASGATAGNITEDTGWKKIAYNGDSLSLNGLELSSGARISIHGSASGAGTLIDGEYFTVDNANTGKSSTITADGIDTPEVTTKKVTMADGTIAMSGTDLSSSIAIKDDYLTASLYADGLYIEDDDTNENTHIGANGITTPSITTDNLTLAGSGNLLSTSNFASETGIGTVYTCSAGSGTASSVTATFSEKLTGTYILNIVVEAASNSEGSMCIVKIEVDSTEKDTIRQSVEFTAEHLSHTMFLTGLNNSTIKVTATRSSGTVGGVDLQAMKIC